MNPSIIIMLIILVVFVVLVAVRIYLNIMDRMRRNGYVRKKKPGRKISKKKKEDSAQTETVLSRANGKYTIGVAGVTNHIGTTTQAIHIALFIQYKLEQKNIKGRVAYVEMNNRGYDVDGNPLPGFVERLRTTQTDIATDKNGNLRYEGMTFVKKENLNTVMTPEYTHLVFDFGSVTADYGTALSAEFMTESFVERSVQILVCGSKPDELAAGELVMNQEVFDRCRYIFSFVPDGQDGDQANILREMDDKAEETIFAKYAPDYFRLEDQVSITPYEKIIPEEIF